MNPYLPIAGGMKRTGRHPRNYRSEKRYYRGTFKSSAAFAAEMSGQPKPPVRHRRPKSMFGGYLEEM